MNKKSKGYLGLLVLFMYAPIFVLVAQSFNASRYRGTWAGFTLNWYRELFGSESILDAFGNTLSIGFTAALLATLLALLTALGMKRIGKKGQVMLRGLANVPLLNAAHSRGRAA